jgi:hypothetical protein
MQRSKVMYSCCLVCLLAAYEVRGWCLYWFLMSKRQRVVMAQQEDAAPGCCGLMGMLFYLGISRGSVDPCLVVWVCCGAVPC